MAIRYRKKYDSWQVYWKNPFSGKQESRSFPTKEEAEEENSLVLHRLKYEPESFRREEKNSEQEAPEKKTLEQVYIEYLIEKQFTKKETICHRGNMRLPLSLLGRKPIAEITQADMEDVKLKFLQDTTISRATVHDRLSCFRTIMYYAVRKGYREQVIFPLIPGAHYQRFVPPSAEELSTLFEAALPHLKRVIVLGAFLGVRVGECELYKLTWEDVDLRQHILRVRGSRKNDDAPWREVPIRDDLVPLFEAWHSEDLASGNTYLVHYRGKPVKGVKGAWSSALKKAGITRYVRPYDLRHAFGTQLVAAGVDIGTVAHLMGHSTPTMLLKHYQYVMDSQKKKAVESLPKLSGMAQRYGARKELTTE